MSAGMEELHAARMNRYAAAMRNGMPSRVSPRPFAAGIAARRAGFTCQQVAHDYDKAFEAAIHRRKDHAWDAAAPNMVYAWTGLFQAIGPRYHGVPGTAVPDGALGQRPIT